MKIRMTIDFDDELRSLIYRDLCRQHDNDLALPRALEQRRTKLATRGECLDFVRDAMHVGEGIALECVTNEGY